MEGPWAVFILLVVMILITAVVLYGRSRQSGGSEGGDMTAVRFTRVIALIWVVLGGLGFIGSMLVILTSHQIEVTLPVVPFWPALPSGAEISGTTATVVSGGFDQATVHVTGLDMPARLWMAAGTALQGALFITIGVVVSMMCNRILRSDPFQPALIKGLNMTGWVVLIAGLGSQACMAVAGGLASEQVLRYHSSTLDHSSVDVADLSHIIGVPGESHAWSVDLWPIWAGLALWTLAVAFRHGQRLQRETAGLV